MHQQAIHPDIDEGIDRKDLSLLRARFVRINHGRQQRALQSLSLRQQRVLKLLPLLLHVNHPLLPGYISGHTPAGLSGFQPSPEQLAEAQQLTRSFSYKPSRGPEPASIHGLFLMGSLGSIAQAEQSDMDLWVCHAPQLNDAARGELRRKCDLLQTWAVSLGCEAHLFLVDPQGFRSGQREAQLSSEDCGSTQHYLLLDEFYRTAIWLAGRIPLWWLVPAYEEHRYEAFAEQLLSKRFIREDDVLDLGHLAQVPASEFIGAGMWQLFKAIESPYKSVLKLLLTEVYASEHPRVECLSLSFKQAVYDGQADLDELDPYMLIYRRLETYLNQRGEEERLELVRRSLYLKVNKKVSRPPRNRTKSWQRLLLEKLTRQWQWSERHLALLDSRSQWKVRQVSSERRALVNELNYSYRFLLQFARAEQPQRSRDLALLGRRLYAAFERRAGKVEFINPGIAADLGEDHLTLVHDATAEPQRWALHPGHLNAQEWPDFAPLKRSRELLELLAWSHRNGVIDSGTRLSLHPGSSDLGEFELQHLIACLQQFLPMPLPPVDDEALLRTSHPLTLVLLVNLGIDPLPQHSQMNLHMTSERTDALAYSGVRDNLVLSLDQITLNSWNELLVTRHDGPDALLDCLIELLNGLPAGRPRPQIVVRCFCRNRANAIAERVDEVLAALLHLQDSGAPSRYLLQISQRYHVIDLAPGAAAHTRLDDFTALLDHLGQPQARHRPLLIDRNALENNDLALILGESRGGCIQVFYRLHDDSAQVTVLDEHGALWRQQYPFHDEQSLLTPLQRFLQALLYRRNAHLPLDGPATSAAVEILYYRILPDAPQRALQLEHRTPPIAANEHPFHDIQAIVASGQNGRRHVTLFCNHREFSELEHGDGLFSAVTRHILEQRQDGERYRCYITDLDLSALLGAGQPQIAQYLRVKSSLEDALNAALRAV